MAGASGGEEGDTQALAASGCGTPGAIDSAMCCLYLGIVGAHPGATAAAGSSLSVGDGGPCGLSIGVVSAEGTTLGDGAASSGNAGIHSTVSEFLSLCTLSKAYLGLQLQSNCFWH
jgi:hypothetical protein